MDQQAKIEDILFGNQFPTSLQEEKPIISHRPEGKASDVYKVELPKNKVTFAVKLLNPEQWQIREIDIYEKYLSVSGLGTPKLVFADKVKGILVLNWIKFSGKYVDYDQLANWLTAKYLNFKTLFGGEAIDFKKNIGWMLLDPISKIGKSLKFSNIKVIQTAFKKKDLIKDKLLEAHGLSLPTVLDHADLESQNIITSDNSIHVIDWANAVKSLGFIDFAQFKKLLREAGKLNLYESHEETFSRLLNLKLEDFAQLISLFAVIREIQLLAYYEDSNVDIEDRRVTSSIEILQEELSLLFR